MTFNSAQQERLLTALERIADALETQGRAVRPASILTDAQLAAKEAPHLHGADTDTHSTKGPY